MIALALLMACTSPTPTPLLATGWFEDTGDSDAPRGCINRVEERRPDVDAAWYWRDPPRITVSNHDPSGYEAYVIDAEGYRLSSELVWTEGSLTTTVQMAQPLKPDAEHTLRVIDCEGTHDTPFRTTTLGLPFKNGVSSIAGRAYHLDLQGADWVEPAGIAALFTLYFDSPGLLDVAYVTDQQLQLRFTLGFFSDNQIRQDTDRDLIPFPIVSFDEKPFFAAEAEQIDLTFSGAVIPVYAFQFSGTFSASGGSIGGGTVSGIGDTRSAGTLVGDDAPGAICALAEGFGVECVPCPRDFLPYCLPVSIQNVQGSHLPGFVFAP